VHHFFNFVHRLRGAPTLHLCYDIVSDVRVPHLEAYHPIRSVLQFKRDLDWLLQHFIPVTLEELADSKRRPRPGFHLSFDGSFRQCYDEIRPVLLQRGIPATFFIDPELIGNHVLAHRHLASLIAVQKPHVRQQALASDNYDELEALAQKNDVDITAFLNKNQPYMRMEQVLALAELGFIIGALGTTAQDLLDNLAQVGRMTENAIPPVIFPSSHTSSAHALLEQLPTGTLAFGCKGLKKTDSVGHFERICMAQTEQSAAGAVWRGLMG
jgi:hypothetical protein